MKNKYWILVVLGIFGLIGVRTVESHIFYDPFLTYFHEANKNALFPEFDWFKLIISHLFRFTLNLFFSSLIIYGIFGRKDWTIQGIVLMLIVFAITFPMYLYAISSKFEMGYLFSFYVRRFVIQPLTVLLIIPIFYYRQHLQKKQ